jgi:hypothetical protein
MRELKQKEELSEDEILKLLQKYPHFLDSYKELNTQSEISNIQIKEQPLLKQDPQECKAIKTTINENIPKLIALEAFEKPADTMIYVVWIGSLVAFLIFVVHNLVVLYTWWYEDYDLAVFASYALLIGLGVWYYKRSLKKHEKKHREFLEIYRETKEAIEKGLKSGCIKEEELYT